MLEELQKHQPKLIRYCNKITGNSDTANDLYQHCVLKLSSHTNIKNLSSYFYRTAYNEFIDKSSSFNKERCSNCNHTEIESISVQAINKSEGSDDLKKEMAISNILSDADKCENIRIFKNYMSSQSYSETGRQLGIDRMTVAKKVKEVNQLIRDEYNRLNSNPDIFDGFVDHLG